MIPVIHTVTDKIVVAVTGASGAVYAKVLLDSLKSTGVSHEHTAVLMSENAKQVWELELGNKDYSQYPFRYYHSRDFSAPFASGSANYRVLIVCPCSMGTLGRIASGISDDLLTRTADVMLKENRTLILVPRETPYNLIHIRNMETLTLAGAVICPASPSFYAKPAGIEAVAATVVNRVLHLAGFPVSGYAWGQEGD